MDRNNQLRWGVLALAGILMSSGAAFADSQQPPKIGDDAAKVEDPFENVNRFTSGFNRVIRSAIIDPLVDGYQAVTPQFMQDAVGNAAANLNEPATAVSSLLQGDTDNAGIATKRFFINSTIGLGGVNDKASELGYQSRQEDLGQTAGYHGAEAGPHIVLPLLGPTNSRDLMGDLLTAVASPLPLVGKVAQGSVEYSTNQDEIKGLSDSALDPYVVERNAYEGRRRFLIGNGETRGPETPQIDLADFK